MATSNTGPMTTDEIDGLAQDYLSERVSAEDFMKEFEAWAKSKGLITESLPTDGYYGYKLTQWYIADDITREMMHAGLRANVDVRMKAKRAAEAAERVNLFPTLTPTPTDDPYVKVLADEGIKLADDMLPVKMEPDLVEVLADAQHTIWAHWMKWMRDEKSDQMQRGYLQDHADWDRWNRQIETPYAELSEAEKESDRQVVRNYILSMPTMRELIKLVQGAWLTEKAATESNYKPGPSIFRDAIRSETMDMLKDAVRSSMIGGDLSPMPIDDNVKIEL